MTAADVPTAIVLIKAAIKRIRDSGEYLRGVSNSAGTQEAEANIKRAKEQFDACEREFSWQWENVEMILEKAEFAQQLARKIMHSPSAPRKSRKRRWKGQK